MSEETDAERKARLWKREREADEERRRSLLEQQEKEKQEKEGQPTIDDSGSTHQIRLKDSDKDKIPDTNDLNDNRRKEEDKPSRFEGIKERFSETGERLKKGMTLSAQGVRKGASYKARDKLGRLTAEERKERLAKLKERLAVAKTEQKIQQIKQHGRAMAAKKQVRIEEFSGQMSDPVQWYGMGKMGEMRPMEVTDWYGLNNGGGGRKQEGNFGLNPAFTGNILDIDGGSRKKGSVNDYNIMNMSGRSRGGGGSLDMAEYSKMMGMSGFTNGSGGNKKSSRSMDDDIRRFYGI